jgi:carotenoid cleavage dioxygenase
MAADPLKHHWFAGDGMVHGIRIERGRARWYRNRWIRSEAVTTALGEPRTEGPRGVFDTVNTNVVGVGGRTFGVVEAGSTPVELGPTLETLRYTDFADGARSGIHGGLAAHPHVDPLSGETHAVCYDVGRPDAVRYVVLTADGHVRREVVIPVRDGPMIHDCAISQRYAIILDLPTTFSMDAAIAGYRFPYRWNAAHPARIGLLPREGEADEIVWCPIDPCFVFHCVNAFDIDDGKVVVDLVVHDRMFWRRTTGPDSEQCGLERWTIDPGTATVDRRMLDPTPQEFPRPDERRLSLPYRFAYTMALTDPFLGTALYKHDLAAGIRQVHDFGPGRMPCEFVFIPAHPDAAEDEGWLMGFVIDAGAATTDLVILDARDFEGPPLASIHLPHVVPPGFHGNWLPTV